MPGKGVQLSSPGRSRPPASPPRRLRPVHQAQRARPPAPRKSARSRPPAAPRPVTLEACVTAISRGIGPQRAAARPRASTKPSARGRDPASRAISAAPQLFRQHPQNAIVLQQRAHHVVAPSATRPLMARLSASVQLNARTATQKGSRAPSAAATSRAGRSTSAGGRQRARDAPRAPDSRWSRGQGGAAPPSERTRRLRVARGRVVQIDFHAHSPIHSFRRVWRIL